LGCIFLPFPDSDRYVRVLLDISPDDPLLVKTASDGVDKHSDSPRLQHPVERLEEYINQRLPRKVTLSNPQWITTFRVNERLAGSYRSGNVFLMGDAAHVHAPAGGQGMNLGLQDAFNLAWKLSLVLQGKGSSEALLSSYESERRPVAKDIINGSSIAASFAASRSVFMRYLRSRVFFPLIPYVLGWLDMNKTVETLGQLALQYAVNPVVCESKVKAAIQTGSRAPTHGTLVSLITGISISPLQIYANSTLHILFCLVLGKGTDSLARDYIPKIKLKFPDLFDTHVLYQNLEVRVDGGPWDDQWYDQSGDVFAFFDFQIKEDAIVYAVVRPDGYLGFLGESESDLYTWINSFLIKSH
jgi:hypothetical protein